MERLALRCAVLHVPAPQAHAPCPACAHAPPPRHRRSSRALAAPPGLEPGALFDAAAFDADRLAKDDAARAAMVLAMEAAPGAWKWAIRKRVWDVMEANNYADFPRPVHHRIPNFVGATEAADKLAGLAAFQSARCIKVNPDTPQRAVRYAALASGKTLLTPQPRLRTGFFNTLSRLNLPPNDEAALREAATSAGAAKYGKPLGIDATGLTVDLIIVGSTAVCPRTGARIGKGALREDTTLRRLRP
jgi:5-formyltetrahydrofolate cyclo-ligase